MIKLLSFPKREVKTIVQTISSTAAVLLIITITGATTGGVVSVWAANLIGTSGPDTLDGTDEDDNILGRGGNDIISDGFGSDRVRAGSGDDTIRVEGIWDPSDPEGETDGLDIVQGDRGEDNIDARNIVGSYLIDGGANDDIVAIGGTEVDTNGKIYGGRGDDEISGGGEGIFDVWGGSGDDYIDGASECVIDRPYGGSGNDRIIQPNDFASGGPGDDFIEFLDCGGTAYGDSGDDELIGGEDARVELHGGSGNDKLEAAFGGDKLFGESGHDTLIGGQGETFFSCGPGTDTIIGFDAAEGDTKTADCENF
jgi:Ca2+-binding RTX toxin-like protein